MRRLIVQVLLACGLIAVVGCASSTAEKFVGQSIEEAYFKLGPPENVFDLTDGRRAFQFYWGGGNFVAPGNATSNMTSNYDGSTTIKTVLTPAQVYSSRGCLITLIAEGSENSEWTIEEWRIPDRLVC